MATSVIIPPFNKSGDTMTGTLTISKENAGVNLAKPSGSDTFVARISTWEDGNGNNRTVISQRNDGQAREEYYFPAPAATLSELKVYNILTTKNTITPAQGGTGETTLQGAANALINALSTGNASNGTDTYIITQHTSGNDTYYRRPASYVRVGGLVTARKLKVALGSTSDATFDGTADQTGIPISGTLGVKNGGTGATTAADARTNLGLAYAAGDTYTITNNRVCAPGVVANSGKTIYVSINTPKSLENISSISVTALSGSISGINGQIANSGGSFDWLSQSGVTVSALKSADNVVRITISKSTAFSNAPTTQTPVVGLLSMTLSFS